MSTTETRSFTSDHPHSHHRNSSSTSSTNSHRLSISSHLATLTHAPTVFLGSIHRHERELVISHQQHQAKKEAFAAIDKYEAGFSNPSANEVNPSPHHRGSTGAARAAMGAGASEEDAAEWAAILAARAAATHRSPTLDLEKEMERAVAERQRRRSLDGERVDEEIQPAVGSEQEGGFDTTRHQ